MTQDWSGLGYISPEGPTGRRPGDEQIAQAVDVIVILTLNQHVLLRCHPPVGAEDVYWALPSGKPDRDDALTTAVQVARTQLDLEIRRQDLKHVGTVHGLPPDRPARCGLFFAVETEADRQGNPRNIDPRCAQLQWFRIDSPPIRLVTYHAVGLDLYRSSQTFATIGWDS